MKELIFATKNKGKMKEIQMIMSETQWKVISMEEAGFFDDIEETGTTFIENALIKAEAICALTQKIVLADDSGLEIDYLNKQPGVQSARFLGYDTDYKIKNQEILRMLQDVPFEKRTARFVCAIAAAIPNHSSLTCEGTLEGVIGLEIDGNNGFGYDPIFYLEEYGCTTARLDHNAKNEISHRGKALRKMKNMLEAVLEND